jgi:Flp pilus assembly protein TadG
MLRRLFSNASKFRNCASGNIAILFGLAVMPIVLAAGSALDYSYAAMARTKLNSSADAAALAAVSQSMMHLSAAQAEASALSMFQADAGTITGVTLDSVLVSVSEAGGTRIAEVSYAARSATALLGIANIAYLGLGGQATASSTLPAYIDFYLLLDNTPSMGVAATTADISRMVNNTPDQCAFACHDLSDGNNYYNLAKKLGVAMRIDVVRTATQQLMDTATAYQSLANQFRVAIYTFGTSATAPGLTTVQTLTTNLAGAKKAASAIDLMTIPYQNYAYDTITNFGPVFTGLNKTISNPGNGSTASSRQKIVMFVSDGTADRALGSPPCSRPTTTGKDPKTGASYVRCQEPFDVSYCTTLKNRGIKVAVLYTTYLPLPTNAWYNNWIAPFQSQLATNMQSCASPGLFFEVNPSQGIAEAMLALFKEAMSQARLTH